MKQTILKLLPVVFAITVLISCKTKSVKVYTAAEITAESAKVKDFFKKVLIMVLTPILNFKQDLVLKKITVN